MKVQYEVNYQRSEAIQVSARAKQDGGTNFDQIRLFRRREVERLDTH